MSLAQHDYPSPAPSGDADGVAEMAARWQDCLDAGASGLWERVEPREPIGSDPLDPGTLLRLEPRTHGQVWRALVGLLDVGSVLS